MKAINYTYLHLFYRVSCFMFWLVTCPSLLGQANQKRMLTTKDYNLWSLLIPDKISNNGNWASYRLLYEYTNKDTLVVQQTIGNKKYIFPYGREGKFNGESEFACIVHDTLILQNLKTEILFKTADVSSFAFSANQKFMAILLKQSDEKLTLEIRDQTGNVLQLISGVTNYSFDPVQNGVVYSIEKDNLYGVEIILFKDSIVKKTIVKNYKAPFQNLIWKENAVAFIENIVADPVLFNYNIIKDKLSSLDSKSATGFPHGMKISVAAYMNPIHSKDGNQIFFWLKEPPNESEISDPMAVQIWNSKDKLLVDFKKFRPYYKLSDKLVLWDLKNNKVLQITDKDLPSGFLSADYSRAFIYDPAAYEPQSKQFGPYDLYVVDLKSGKKQCIIEHYTFDEKPSGSPDGGFLCYAKEAQWWIYDIQKNLHTCITFGMPNSFFSEDTDRPREDAPYGIAGWSSDGEIILYDRYDLWKISLDGKVKKRLTKGREIGRTFRAKVFNSDPVYSETESNKHALNLNDGFLMLATNKKTGAAGLSYWNSKSGIKELLWTNKKITQVSRAANNDIYMYLDQNFESAPRLMVYNGRSVEIVQSNKQQEHFYWGRNEGIEYIDNGLKTKGILFYPAVYKAGVKYPLIVHIYERQFSALNDYVNPSLLTADGFNVSNFTAQGYFVLYPDINYEYGNLRESVTRSVLTAVDTVIAKGDIDPNKVGLIGHSFGGYETDLIITQTDRFAAAVAGAAITDLVSAYLYVGQTYRRPDFFRTEDHQLRIGKSLYEDMQSYIRNSPVLLAANITTPLLGWTGEEDRTVHSLQTMEFYLALRRLNKEHSLLVYPGEEHTIDKKENALDLNTRIMQWFDYYLKNGKKEEWMKSDFNR